MFKWLVLLGLAGGGYYYYNTSIAKSPAFQTYEKFAEAMRQGKCSDLYALCDGQAKAMVDEYCKRHTMTVYGITKELPSAADLANDMAGTPQGATTRISRKKESEVKSEDGNEVTLVIVESAKFHPASSMKPGDPVKVTAKLRKSGEVWKVVEYVDPAVSQLAGK